ncbi:primosomal protein N' [Calothrix sp. NIES-3974]|uniref:primosomal protein N' n=1 Tax=Calothrix sp. NIES-3974 TaxID=2005462 RepID=UPI000B5F36A1|nr:primosomal protein N' [Calothrix sp. NIES-3974]BAZ07715.1 primosomal protein N' [Calothrix sp. NIES-3974]
MLIKDVNESGLIVAEPEQGYHSQNRKSAWVEVLVDCPGVVGLFAYQVPEHLKIEPGDILSVPFGAQIVGGVAIRLLETPPTDISPDKIRQVEDIASKGFFPPTYWQLLNQVANYYYTPLMQVIRCALPPGLLGRSQRRIRLCRAIAPQESQYLSPTAQQILNLLVNSPNQEYSFNYLQRQIKAAYRGVRELTRWGLVESYVQPPRLSRPKLQKAVILTGSPHDIELTSRQREIIEILRRRGGEMWQSELLQACSASSSSLKSLADKGYIVIEEREVLRYEAATISPHFRGEPAKQLTPAQIQALETINSVSGAATMLLHGVTGSGKTEVYLQAISPVLQQGKSALVLVPEIGLTPQLTDRFRTRFGHKVRVYHSALSEGERYDTWREMLAGEALVVIGTRSAIFAPLPHLDLIILDEEHDSSFKQDSPPPTYHTRTVAQWRAELENCRLILGSATPALETWMQVHNGQNSPGTNQKYYYLSLPERVNARPLPPVEVVDMRLELQQGNKSIFSRSLLRGLRELQANGQQGILFIHRRGYSTFVSCRSCGHVMECPHCDVSLAYHHTDADATKLLRCHYCNFTQLHPPHCPECGSPYFKFFGSGTQRVAQELAKVLPELRVIRFDSDTTRTKGSHRTLLTQFANGEADILLGTQMLTKGLDLPQVTLVGIIAADGLLHLCDYRASERAFQTLTQVAGRAGRSETPGKVILQTYTTEHPVIAAVSEMPQAANSGYHNYQAFIDTELEQRRDLNYPPYGRLILLRLSSLDPIQVQNTANMIATALAGHPGYEILGPAPASIMRVANRYRWQILLKFNSHELPQIPDWEGIRSLCPPSVSLTIDVDPLNIM